MIVVIKVICSTLFCYSCCERSQTSLKKRYFFSCIVLKGYPCHVIWRSICLIMLLFSTFQKPSTVKTDLETGIHRVASLYDVHLTTSKCHLVSLSLSLSISNLYLSWVSSMSKSSLRQNKHTIKTRCTYTTPPQNAILSLLSLTAKTNMTSWPWHHRLWKKRIK